MSNSVLSGLLSPHRKVLERLFGCWVALRVALVARKFNARKKLRKDVGEALKGVYIVNNRELSDKTIKQMKAALLNLDYTVDFKNISELRKMDYKSNVWPICLSLMRDDNITNEIKSFTYFLFKISDLCGDELWTKGNDDWFYPLLK